MLVDDTTIGYVVEREEELFRCAIQTLEWKGKECKVEPEKSDQRQSPMRQIVVQNCPRCCRVNQLPAGDVVKNANGLLSVICCDIEYEKICSLVGLDIIITANLVQQRDIKIGGRDKENMKIFHLEIGRSLELIIQMGGRNRNLHI